MNKTKTTNIKSRMCGESGAQNLGLIDAVKRSEKYVIWDSIDKKTHIIPDDIFREMLEQAKEEGRREEREELLKELPKKKYINFNSEGMNSITGFNNCLDQVKQLLKAPRSI